jgi:hypothetical protein
MIMTEFDLVSTQRSVRLYTYLNWFCWLMNVLLLGLAIYQFASVGYTFVIDTFFIWVNALNVIFLYLTYKVFDVLSLYKHRLNYILTQQTHENV